MLFLGFIFIDNNSDEKNSTFGVFELLTLIFFLGCALFFVIYYFTMPKKECIFNREEGLFTFPGFMWHKNITMSIENVIFTMSGPCGSGMNGFQLLVERPDQLYSKYLCTLGHSCYDDLSFYLW